jgi:hypothetical protein
MGRYILAKKETYYWKRVVTATDCSNEKGHSWEWIFGKQADSIRKEHPRLTAAITKCIYCGRVSCSM